MSDAVQRCKRCGFALKDGIPVDRERHLSIDYCLAAATEVADALVREVEAMKRTLKDKAELASQICERYLAGQKEAERQLAEAQQQLAEYKQLEADVDLMWQLKQAQQRIAELEAEVRYNQAEAYKADKQAEEAEARLAAAGKNADAACKEVGMVGDFLSIEQCVFMLKSVLLQERQRLATRDQAWCDELEKATGALIEPHHGPSVVVKHHVDVFRQRLTEVVVALEEVRKKCIVDRIGRYEIMQSGTCGYMSPNPFGLYVYFRDLESLARAIIEQAEAALAKVRP